MHARPFHVFTCFPAFNQIFDAVQLVVSRRVVKRSAAIIIQVVNRLAYLLHVQQLLQTLQISSTRALCKVQSTHLLYKSTSALYKSTYVLYKGTSALYKSTYALYKSTYALYTYTYA